MAIRLDRDKLLAALKIPIMGPATVIVASKTSRKPENADYRCDGVDDQIEIQKAIEDAHAAGGGMVYLMEGTYYLRRQMDFLPRPDNYCCIRPLPRVAIVGAGMNCTKLLLEPVEVAYPTVHVIGVWDTTDIILKGFELDANSPAQPAEYRGFGAIMQGNVERVLVEQLHTHHTFWDNILVLGDANKPTRDVVIQNCIGHDSVREGIYRFVSLTRGIMTNNLCHTCDENALEVDVWVPAGVSIEARDVVVSNNVCWGVTGFGGIGVDNAVDSTALVRDVVFVGNVVLGSVEGFRAFWTSGYPTPAYARIVITGNVFRDNTGDGIRLQQLISSIITGNLCTGNGGYGVDEETGGDYNLIHGNWLRGNTAGAISTVGVNTISADNLV